MSSTASTTAAHSTQAHQRPLSTGFMRALAASKATERRTVADGNYAGNRRSAANTHH